MAQQVMQCERMGGNPKWPSYKSVLGRIAKVPTHEEFYRNKIREYVTHEDMAPTKQIPNTHNATNDNAEWLASIQAHRALATAPEKPSWLSDLAYWLRYFQVGTKQRKKGSETIKVKFG
jgi:hypothetical protein